MNFDDDTGRASNTAQSLVFIRDLLSWQSGPLNRDDTLTHAGARMRTTD